MIVYPWRMLQSAPSASPTPEDTIAAIPKTIERLRESFESGRTRPLDWRKRQLDGIARFCVEKEAELLAALKKDLRKPSIEAWAAEINFVRHDAEYTKKRLRKWTAPQRVRTPLVAQPGKSEVTKQPLGVVLIIAPWNYPFQLLLAPLVAAIGAGNCAVLKPSEISPNVSRVVATWLPRYVDQGCVQVIEGAVKETTALLEERFDHIFYTGNGTVGRIVMQAAAKHLTPVTLELGGKSPVVVDQHVDLDVAAKRIVYGKFFNAGQTCVAPDYVLVHEAVHDALINKMAAAIREFYGEDPQKSPDLARIINARHHARVMKLIEGQSVVVGGKSDVGDLYIAPTILKDVAPDAPVMQDEIFGPVLPVLAMPSVDRAIRFVNEREKPLALYAFSSNSATAQRIVARTSSGGAAINHVWLHLAVPELPFGGVGESGMGAYHGRHGFDCFTHQRAVLTKPTALDPSFVYPPYTATKQAIIKKVL